MFKRFLFAKGPLVIFKSINLHKHPQLNNKISNVKSMASNKLTELLMKLLFNKKHDQVLYVDRSQVEIHQWE